jgi:hypothetical protein
MEKLPATANETQSTLESPLLKTLTDFEVSDSLNVTFDSLKKVIK